MLPIFDPIRDVTLLSVTVRIILAVLCGGVVGVEREFKRRPAGFRTHILICLGAALTTLTSQYMFLVMGLYTDMARLGAQVVAGIGFIGAGTIIVTRRQRVKGLTTAAGLWVSAIIGLALGAGFYEGGLFGTALILVAEVFFAKVEHNIWKNAAEMNILVEYQDSRCLDRVLQVCRSQALKVLDIEITHSGAEDSRLTCVILSLRLNRSCNSERVLTLMGLVEGVVSVKEL